MLAWRTHGRRWTESIMQSVWNEPTLRGTLRQRRRLGILYSRRVDTVYVSSHERAPENQVRGSVAFRERTVYKK